MSTTRYIIDNINGILTGQSVDGNFSATTFFGDGSGLTNINPTQPINYAELRNMLMSSGLTSGNSYKITDYRTVNFLHGQFYADNQQPSLDLDLAMLDPDFKNLAGFDDGVHAIKEVELGSIYFDGTSSNRITIENSTDLWIGNNADFTIEWFQFMTGSRSTSPRVFSIGSYPSAHIALSFESGPLNRLWWNTDPTPIQFDLDTPIENTWVHFAIVRSGDIIKIYQNGKQVYSGNHSEAIVYADDIYIGNQQALDAPFEGYITNFRFDPFGAEYFSNFTPPTKPIKPNDNLEILLLSMSKKKLTRNSNIGEFTISSVGTEWSKKTPFEDERKIYVGGYFTMHETDQAYHLARLNQDGTLDKTFHIPGSNYSVESGFTDVVKCIEIQDDGKILVGGNFQDFNNRSCGHIVRLNDDGSQDMDFMTSQDGYGFDSTVRAIVPMQNGKIIVGGDFSTYDDDVNGSTNVFNMCRLNKDGTVDTTYTQANNYFFNGSVYNIRMVNPSDFNSPFYVCGNFTQWVDATQSGVSASRIIRLNYDWTYDSNFYIENGGFNRRASDFAIQDDGSIVVVGGANSGGRYTQYTYCGSTITANSIIRLFPDASPDLSFSTGSGFNNYTNSVSLLEDGSIVVGGNFTEFDGNFVSRLAVLDQFGSLNGFFGTDYFPSDTVIKVVTLSDGNILCGGWFNEIQNYGNKLGYIAKYVTSVKPSGFSWSGTNVGDVEPLVVRASSESTLEPLAYSEMHPGDIIEYNPYQNSIGYNFGIYNGRTMPDSSLVSGFDIQWDGTKAYFEMPEGYPVVFGSFLQIQATFSFDESEMYMSFPCPIPSEIQYPLISTSYNSNDPYSRISITTGGTRVYLEDFGFQEYTAYDPDSLYVVIKIPVADSYGKITKRTDTFKKITTPFDFRSVRFRRYEMHLETTVFTMNNSFVGLSDNYLGQGENMTGRYYDFPVFGFRGMNSSNIKWDSSDIDSNYFSDNNVFLESFEDVIVNSRIYNNTSIGLFNQNTINGLMYENTFSNGISKSTTNGNFYSNRFNSSIEENEFGDGFVSNNVNGNFSNNRIGKSFFANSVFQDFSYNNVGSNFSYNVLKGNSGYNKIGINCTQNTFQGSFNYNNTIADLSNNIFSGSVSYSSFKQFIGNNIWNTMNNTEVRCYFNYKILSADTSGNDSKEILEQDGGGKFLSLMSGGTMVYLSI